MDECEISAFSRPGKCLPFRLGEASAGPNDPGRKPPRPAPALRYRRGAEHLHRLGARAAAEFLAEVGRAHGIEDDVLARLDLWRDLLSPEVVEAAGAGGFPPLLRVVRP